VTRSNEKLRIGIGTGNLSTNKKEEEEEGMCDGVYDLHN
jgi:hypothetical protein